MESELIMKVLFDDFNKHLSKAAFTCLRAYAVNSRCIPFKDVLAASQFHSHYKAYEVILKEPSNGKIPRRNYKYFVVFHLMMTPFFAIHLKCANTDCARSWWGFWRKRKSTSSKFSKHPTITHWVMLDNKNHHESCMMIPNEVTKDNE